MLEIEKGYGKVIILQLQVLMSIRTESAFDQFWYVIALEQQRLDVDDPDMPRKRKVPTRFEDGLQDTYQNPTNVKELYQPLYFESLESCRSRYQGAL